MKDLLASRTIESWKLGIDGSTQGEAQSIAAYLMGVTAIECVNLVEIKTRNQFPNYQTYLSCVCRRVKVPHGRIGHVQGTRIHNMSWFGRMGVGVLDGG